MSSISNSYSTTSITSSPSRSNYNTSNRSKPKYIILRSCGGWRPNSLPTPILILRTSRSIYSNSTRIRSNLTHCSTQYSQTRTIRNSGNNLCHSRNFNYWLHCMSTSHVYSRDRCRYSSLLYSSYNNYCSTYRN